MNIVQSIDYFLDRITMYRLMLYVLIVLLCIAGVGSLFQLTSFSLLALLKSTVFILIVCLSANTLFSWAYDAPTNFESVYITALILALITFPAATLNDYLFLFLGINPCNGVKVYLGDP